MYKLKLMWWWSVLHLSLSCVGQCLEQFDFSRGEWVLTNVVKETSDKAKKLNVFVVYDRTVISTIWNSLHIDSTNVLRTPIRYYTNILRLYKKDSLVCEVYIDIVSSRANVSGGGMNFTIASTSSKAVTSLDHSGEALCQIEVFFSKREDAVTFARYFDKHFPYFTRRCNALPTGRDDWMTYEGFMWVHVEVEENRRVRPAYHNMKQRYKDSLIALGSVPAFPNYNDFDETVEGKQYRDSVDRAVDQEVRAQVVQYLGDSSRYRIELNHLAGTTYYFLFHGNYSDSYIDFGYPKSSYRFHTPLQLQVYGLKKSEINRICKQLGIKEFSINATRN